MNKVHRTRHRDVVKQLYQRVENLYTEFISIAHLHDMGIEASQVTLNETGTFNFSPCFFEPQQPGLFDRYPIDPTEEREIPELNDQPSWDRCLKHVLASDEGQSVDEEKVFKYARSRYKREIRCLNPDDSYRRSGETQLYIDSVISASRSGTEKRYFCLEDLSPLGAQFRTRQRKGEPAIDGIIRGICCKAEDCLEDSKIEDPIPHAVLTNCIGFQASLAEDCLTRLELNTIVNFLVMRSRRKTWAKHRIQPILLIAYTGLKHGRIIQAHYDYDHDGGKLTLQFSQLFNFEDENTAPIELFVRYYLSAPVGSTL